MGEFHGEKQISIGKLKYRNIVMLAEKLEITGFRKDWRDVGKDLMPTMHCEIDFLLHGYPYDKSGSWNFLQKLKITHTNCTIFKFRTLAHAFRRKDIFMFLESLSHDLLSDIWVLTTKEMVILISYLERRSSTLGNWEMFADSFNYSYNEIMELKCKTFENPVHLLFEMLNSLEPPCTLDALISSCYNVERGDVGLKLLEFKDLL